MPLVCPAPQQSAEAQLTANNYRPAALLRIRLNGWAQDVAAELCGEVHDLVGRRVFHVIDELLKAAKR